MLATSKLSSASVAPRAEKDKKKDLGREKPCSVKRACEGARKRPPPLTKRPWTPCVRGSLALLATKDADKIPNKGAANMRPPKNGRSPWPSLGRGAGETTAGLVRPPPVILEKVWPQNKRGKRKTKQEQHTKTLAASRPKKRPQKVQGESQKRPGPRMAPRKNAKKRDARPKRAEQTQAAGHKKEKKPENKCVCGGVLLLPELYLLKKKNKNKNRKRRRRRRRRKNQRKRERTQKKPDLTSSVPHPLPGVSFTVFGRKGVGGWDRVNAPFPEWLHGMPVPTLRPQKTTMVIIKTWGGRCLVSLPLLNLSEKYLACNATPVKAPPQKTQQRPPDRQTRQREKPEKHPRERRRKKKTRRGGNLGEEEHEDERVEGEVHVRDEETQGESQTPEKGFGFPQRLRKKERKKERERERERERRRRNQPNNQRKKRGQQTPKRTRGQVLKGTKANNIPTPKTKPRTKQPKTSQNNLTKRQEPTQQVSEDFTLQGGGAHGPPCTFWGDTPGDRGTEGSEDPPTTGTAPGGARTSIMSDKSLVPQKVGPDS